MEQFLEEVMTPYWILSVFVVGLVINLISQYVPPLIGKFWRKSRDRTVEMNTRRKKEARFLMTKPELMMPYGIELLADMVLYGGAIILLAIITYANISRLGDRPFDLGIFLYLLSLVVVPGVMLFKMLFGVVERVFILKYTYNELWNKAVAEYQKEPDEAGSSLS